MTWYMDKWHKRAIRLALMREQNGLCAYCRRSMTMEKAHARKARFATVDHLVPLVMGGTNDPANLVLCCRLCNIVKGDSTLEEFVFGLLWIWLCKKRPLVAWVLHQAQRLSLPDDRRFCQESLIRALGDACGPGCPGPGRCAAAAHPSHPYREAGSCHPLAGQPAKTVSAARTLRLSVDSLTPVRSPRGKGSERKCSEPVNHTERKLPMERRKNDEQSQLSPTPWSLKLDGLIRDANGSIIVVCYRPEDAEHIIGCVSRGEQPAAPSRRQLPPDPDCQNDDRAKWASTALKAFQNETGADDEDALGDLLTDLMHWADREGFDFDLALNRAGGHYEAETGREG